MKILPCFELKNRFIVGFSPRNTKSEDIIIEVTESLFIVIHASHTISFQLAMTSVGKLRSTFQSDI